MNSEFRTRLSAVQERVDAACQRAGRRPSHVRLMAVTKTHPVSSMLAALEAGLDDLGESRVQDALPKLAELPSTARVHLIGRLQSNKVNKAVGAFASIESVDRIDLLEKIATRASRVELCQPIWIEVNASEESQKGGCAPGDAPWLWERALQEPGLEPLGLMTLARADADEVHARACFARLRELGQRLRRGDGVTARLSMGMSRDFEWAILEGSHEIRLGSVLFGPRGGA